LTPGRLADIADKTHAASAGLLSLPRFTTTSKHDLVPPLNALGMHAAFCPNDADLSGLSSVATCVAQVIQRVYLSVGEQGTTAAAVTGVAIEAISGAFGSKMITFDHPFLFLIRDTKTGVIVFASEI